MHIKNDAATTGNNIIYCITFTKVNEDSTTFFNIRLGKQNLKTSYAAQKSVPPNTALPRTISADIGTNIKIKQKLVLNAAVWAMDLETEYVYSGDDGTISPSGNTRRYWLDVSARYQIYKNLFADADLNFAKPRFRDLPEGKNVVPIAPTFTSAGGLSYVSNDGFSGSVRYRTWPAGLALKSIHC